MAEKGTDVKIAEKKISPGMPNWVIPVGAVLAVLIFAWVIQPSAFKANVNAPAAAPPVTAPIVAPAVAAPLPDKVSDVSVSPLAPLAGNDITFSVEIKSQYLSGWQEKFSYELWVRQFGNWQKTSCYTSPCSYVMKAASLGTVEYKVVRTAKDGTITEEGSSYVEVESTTKTGDTLGPKITVYHSPENPKSGQSVSIISLVTDISPLAKIEIYNDGALVKTCSQAVKIAQCQIAIPNLSVGTFEYYVIASDSLGNITQSPAGKAYTVSVK